MAARKKPVLSVTSMQEADQLKVLEELKTWLADRKELADVVERELASRQKIAQRFIQFGEGSHRMSLFKGANLDCDNKVNRSVVTEQWEAARAYAIDKGDTELAGILDKAIVVKPQVAVGEFKNLSDAERKRIADVVTEKPGAPQLKYVEGGD